VVSVGTIDAVSPASLDRRGSRTRFVAVVGALLVGTVAARRLGYKVGGNTIVRCRQGHLFTTLWIPGVIMKGLDFGIARWQRCPVGEHWSLVIPVRDTDLTDEDRRVAGEHHDLWIP
jgi:hypothetical protein